jgi:hypothetical protein
MAPHVAWLWTGALTPFQLCLGRPSPGLGIAFESKRAAEDRMPAPADLRLPAFASRSNGCHVRSVLRQICGSPDRRAFSGVGWSAWSRCARRTGLGSMKARKIRQLPCPLAIRYTFRTTDAQHP